MSDTHVDKDRIARVNYNEILASLATGIIASPIAMPSASMVAALLSSIYDGLKSLQKSKPTPTENLVQVIEAGKEQEVSELEVDIDKSTLAGVNLELLEQLGGVNATIGDQHQEPRYY